MLFGEPSDVVQFLRNVPEAGGGKVEIVTTHASLVFLAGDRAFKLKRAVRYPYLDFSTPERRLDACRTELELNRRTAPSLYLGVRTITRDTDGRLAFDGRGSLVDAVVEMRRFGQEHLFDAMAQKGALTPLLLTELARRTAAFHKSAAVSFEHGGAAGIAAVLDINDRALRGTTLVGTEVAKAFADTFRQALAAHSERLEARRKAGKVRRCHGDLILRNICLIDGEPTLFDCLEFDEALATIDVLYDLAFLLMDLWHRDQHRLASIVFNRYLDECDETDGLPLVPFFMAIRAAVRAHVTAAQADKTTGDEAERLSREARAYFDLASTLLEKRDPVLLAIGGFSGSGKSTIASLVAPRLGPPPGARTLNSDRIRKRMHGAAAEERLPASTYRPEVSDEVYRSLRREAADVLAAGYAVVADAVFDRPAEREAIGGSAADAGVPFHGIWLDVPEAALLDRLAARRNDPSDATAEVLLAQLQRECGEISWHRIDAAGLPEAVRDAVLARLRTTS
jgi:uncharacterized protein